MSQQDNGADLLAMLGDLAREREREEDQWFEAAEKGNADALPEAAREHVEAFAPLTEDELDDIAGGLADMIGPSNVVAFEPKARGTDTETKSQDESEPAAPIPISRGRKVWPIVAPLLAIAAAALFVVFRPPAASLPTYDLTVSGADQQWRSDKPAAKTVKHTIGSTLQVVLRPESRPEHKVQVVVFAQGEGGTTKVDLSPQVADTGAIRVVAKLGRDLDLKPGPWTLLFLLAPDGTSISDADTTDASVRRMKYDFIVVAPSE